MLSRTARYTARSDVPGSTGSIPFGLAQEPRTRIAKTKRRIGYLSVAPLYKALRNCTTRSTSSYPACRCAAWLTSMSDGPAHVPSGQYQTRRRTTQVAHAVCRCDRAGLTRKQRDVVVLPQHRQRFFVSATGDLHSHEERNRPAGVLERHSCLTRAATAAEMRCHIHRGVGHAPPRCVIRVFLYGRHVPGGRGGQD